MRAFLLNVSFFTRLPVAKFAPYSDERYQKSIKYFPYIGLIIGFFVALPTLITSLPEMYTAVLSILVYLIISGGIHLDGYADTLDGLLSGRTGERVFEIMKDSRMGAFGTIGIGLYFLILFVFLQNLSFNIVLLSPYVAKLCASIIAGFSKYPVEKTGMGKLFLDVNTFATGGVHFVIGLLLIFILGNLNAVIAMFICMAIAFYIRHWHYRIIGGLTGDSIGFIVESSWLIFIVAYQIISILI